MKYGRPYQVRVSSDTILKGYSWPLPNSVANVVLVTGMAEASYRYDEFAHFLNEHGYGVYCIDHYGQGMNTEKPEDMGVWPKGGFRKAVQMVYANAMEVVKLGKPVYVFAHSMGSFVTQEFIQVYGNMIDKVVLCGSCGKQVAAKMGAFISNITCLFHDRDTYQAKAMHKLTFGAYNKKVPDAKTSCDWLSHNEESIQEYLNDFRCNYIPTAGFYKEFMAGLNRIHRKKNVAKVPYDLPILLIAGEEDPVGHYGKGVESLYKMYRNAGIQDVTMHLYPHFRHEILNELNNEKVLEDILYFFKEN